MALAALPSECSEGVAERAEDLVGEAEFGWEEGWEDGCDMDVPHGGSDPFLRLRLNLCEPVELCRDGAFGLDDCTVGSRLTVRLPVPFLFGEGALRSMSSCQLEPMGATSSTTLAVGVGAGLRNVTFLAWTSPMLIVRSLSSIQGPLMSGAMSSPSS